MNAGELLERLATKYPSEKGWARFFEFPLWGPSTARRRGFDLPGGTDRRIDFLAYGLWRSTGFRTVAVEVKVDRADWLRELDEPEKRDRFEAECSEFWICAPKGLVELAELPDGLGLFEPYGVGLRKKRAAKYHRGRTPKPDFFHALVKRLAENLRRKEIELARRGEEFAEFRGKPLSLLDLRRYAERFVEQERGRYDRTYGDVDAQREVRRKRGEKVARFLSEWEEVFGEIRSAMRRSGFEVQKTWGTPSPEEVLRWVAAQEAPARIENGRVELAKKLRKLAVELDPPNAAELFG